MMSETTDWRCPNCGQPHPDDRFQTPGGCVGCAPVEGRTRPKVMPSAPVSLGFLQGMATFFGFLAFAAAVVGLLLAADGFARNNVVAGFAVLLNALVVVLILWALSRAIRLLLFLERRTRSADGPARPDNA